MLALHILREEMTKERKKETGTKEREEKSMRVKRIETEWPHALSIHILLSRLYVSRDSY